MGRALWQQEPNLGGDGRRPRARRVKRDPQTQGRAEGQGGARFADPAQTAATAVDQAPAAGPAPRPVGRGAQGLLKVRATGRAGYRRGQRLDRREARNATPRATPRVDTGYIMQLACIPSWYNVGLHCRRSCCCLCRY